VVVDDIMDSKIAMTLAASEAELHPVAPAAPTVIDPDITGIAGHPPLPTMSDDDIHTFTNGICNGTRSLYRCLSVARDSAARDLTDAVSLVLLRGLLTSWLPKSASNPTIISVEYVRWVSWGTRQGRVHGHTHGALKWVIPGFNPPEFRDIVCNIVPIVECEDMPGTKIVPQFPKYGRPTILHLHEELRKKWQAALHTVPRVVDGDKS